MRVFIAVECMLRSSLKYLEAARRPGALTTADSRSRLDLARQRHHEIVKGQPTSWRWHKLPDAFAGKCENVPEGESDLWRLFPSKAVQDSMTLLGNCEDCT